MCGFTLVSDRTLGHLEDLHCPSLLRCVPVMMIRCSNGTVAILVRHVQSPSRLKKEAVVALRL